MENITSEHIIEINKLCKSFGEIRAVQDLSFHVNQGELFAFLGVNGAGKSTTISIMCGQTLKDSGSVIICESDIDSGVHDISRKLGVVFQSSVLDQMMTVEENLALAAGRGGWLSHVSKADKKAFRERVALLDMGLENRMSQPVGLLSGGQRQALTLMMATFNPPELLLLDEHTAALDPGTAEKVLSLTEKIVAENKLTCMMITHNMQSALELGNRTIMMNNGQIIMDTSGEERKALTVADLLQKFKEAAGRDLDNDRMLLI